MSFTFRVEVKAGSCEHGNEPSNYIGLKGGKFLVEQLSVCQDGLHHGVICIPFT